MLQNLTSNITRPVGKGSAVSISEECYKELKEDIDAVDARVDALSDNVVTECIQADRGNITTLNSDSIETDNVITDGLSSNSAIVTNANIDHITNKDISTECVTSNCVTTDTATIDTATIDTATINHLNLTSATVPTLSSTSVTSNCINTCNATADTISAGSLTSSTVCSDTANITSLTANNITAASTITAPVTNTTFVNAQNVTATNKVEANTVDAVKAVIQDIENTGIKANGTINLDPELPSTNDYYQLFIPEFDNFYATFYGNSNGRKLAISVVGTKKTAIVQASQDVLGLITDVEFKRNTGIYIKFKADEQLNYHIIYNSANFDKNSINVTLNGTNTAEYSYAVDKVGFYIFRGYNSNDISAIIPVKANIHAIEAGEQHYKESTTDVLKIYDKLYVVDTVDPAGTAITLTSGEDNQYLSIFDTGAVDSDGCAILHPTYKTPVDTTTGCLSNSQCLITERAVSTWNGATNAGYPISHLNETTCAHGDLNVVCGITSDSLTVADTATITCAAITDETITNSTISNASVSCATITEETVTDSAISTATITDATITDATITDATIDELSANTINVACDVKIAGDLYVDGTTHTVSQEDIEVEGDTLALRVNNPTSLTAGQVSGIMINKYNGTDNLTIAADCTGTARVGTGTGTDTSYTDIAYDDVTHKWYDYDGSTYTEMATQPTGTVTSYTNKVVDAPYTRYSTITFTAIDITSLEPILTRAEEADMENGYLTKWDCTNKRAVTCGASHTHDLCVSGNACVQCTVSAHFAGVDCLHVSCDANVLGRVTACFIQTNYGAYIGGTMDTENAFIRCCTTLLGTTCACSDVTMNRNLTVKGDTVNCGSTEICGDLTVHGDITIGGDISLDKIGTVENTSDCAQYLTFVADNNTAMASEQVRTDADITYNPYTDTMTVPVICATSCVTTPLVCGNLCGTATTGVCSCCTYISSNGTNASYPLTFTSSATDGQKELYTAASSLTYNPSTDVLTASCFCGTVTNAANVYRTSSNLGYDFDVMLTNGCTSAYTSPFVSSSCRLRYHNTTGVLKITDCSGNISGTVSATTFCGALSGTATNATCFGGCTYACACAAFRSGLTGCTGTVTVSNSTSSSAVPLALCTGATAIGRSTCCALTYVPATGILTATTFCGNLCGTAEKAVKLTSSCWSDSSYTANCDRNIIVTSGTGGTVTEHGVSTCCTLTLNPGTGVMKSSICGITGCCAGYICGLNSANGGTRYALLDLGTGYEGQKIDIVQYFNRSQIVTACSGSVFYNANTYGGQSIYQPSSSTARCIWLRYSAYIAPKIISTYPVCVICDTTTAPSGATWNAGITDSTQCVISNGNNVKLYPTFVAAYCETSGCGCNTTMYADNGGNIYYNPSTNVLTAQAFCGTLCGLAACSSKIAVNCCTESEVFYIPFLTSNTGTYAGLSYETSLQYDPDEQSLGAWIVSSNEVDSRCVTASCMLCARQRCAYDFVNYYGTTSSNRANVLQKDSTLCTTELIIGFSCTTLQCNLFNAIVCNVDLCRAAGANYTPAQGYYGLDGSTFIRWDSSESPRNIDFISNSGTVQWTVYCGCTCTINKEGAVKIFGKLGATVL